MTDVPLLTLNNGVQIPALGFGVFQTPPDETDRRRRDGAGDRLPAHRHRRGVRQRARGRRGDPPLRPRPRPRSSSRPRSGSATTATTQTLHAFDKSAGKLGIDQIDLLILHQALPGEFDLTVDAYRALEKLLADGKVRAIGVSNFMPDHLARLLAETVGGAGGQPDRGAPLLPPVRAARGRRRARHPVPGVVADRRHHLLPRRLARQHAARTRPSARSPRRTARRRPR